MNAETRASVLPAAGIEAAPRGGLAEWIELGKPRITGFVLYAALIGALLAGGPGGASFAVAAEAALWIACTAAAASAFNQVIERDLDARMLRTRGRPLPSGRIRAREAILFGAGLAAVGTTGLAARFGLLPALLALATLVAYALVYTPLKRHSSLNTAIGAVPGAMPPLLGFVAVRGEPGAWGWMLFAVVFVWQFPHFLAIAWLHREDYARAGMRMLPALPGSEGLAGRQALLYALVLLPVSLLPIARGAAGPAYAVAAAVLGLAYCGAALAFALCESERRARALLRVSLVHLPLLLTAALLDPVLSAVLP